MLWIIKQGREEVLVTTEVGEKSPYLTLPSDTWENKVSLEEVRREGPVALFFHPGDWLSVGAEEMG
jgi:peroxiredoxin